MDQETVSLKLNISQLAGITGVHQQTVTAKLKGVESATGSNSRLKLYLVTDILSELIIPIVSTSNVEKMELSGRPAHWKAENERLKFEVDTKQLVPAEDAAKEFSLIAKAVVAVLEALPDILGCDYALAPAAVSRVQDAINDLHDQVAQKAMDAEQEEEEPKED